MFLFVLCTLKLSTTLFYIMIDMEEKVLEAVLMVGGRSFHKLEQVVVDNSWTKCKRSVRPKFGFTDPIHI